MMSTFAVPRPLDLGSTLFALRVPPVASEGAPPDFAQLLADGPAIATGKPLPPTLQSPAADGGPVPVRQRAITMDGEPTAALDPVLAWLLPMTPEATDPTPPPSERARKRVVDHADAQGGAPTVALPFAMSPTPADAVAQPVPPRTADAASSGLNPPLTATSDRPGGRSIPDQPRIHPAPTKLVATDQQSVAPDGTAMPTPTIDPPASPVAATPVRLVWVRVGSEPGSGPSPKARPSGSSAAEAVADSGTPKPASADRALAVAAVRSQPPAMPDNTLSLRPIAVAPPVAAAETPTTGVLAVPEPLLAPQPAPAVAAAQVAGGQTPGFDLNQDPGLERMIDRIVQLREAAAEGADVRDTRIRLIPDALGPVEVAVRREGDGVRVHFAAAEPAARQLIADAAPRLTELAEARGVRVERATVGADAHAQEQPADERPRPSAQAPIPTRPASARRDESDTDDHRIA